MQLGDDDSGDSAPSSPRHREGSGTPGLPSTSGAGAQEYALFRLKSDVLHPGAYIEQTTTSVLRSLQQQHPCRMKSYMIFLPPPLQLPNFSDLALGDPPPLAGAGDEPGAGRGASLGHTCVHPPPMPPPLPAPAAAPRLRRKTSRRWLRP